MPELKLYTVAQLREWIENSHATEGLSETIIAPKRAYAIIHNPYVKDDDPVVAAIFVDGENAAYTTAFPELIDGKRYWWFSALWCSPKYEGQAFGLVVIGSLAEIYGVENCIDRWGADGTIQILNYFGHQTSYTSRYALGCKIDKTTQKGKMVALVRALQRCLHKLIERRIKREDYTLRYIPFIDDKTYAFIRAQRRNSYFLRTQKTLNWILQYPFTNSAPLMERVINSMPFSRSEIASTQMYAVQVLDEKELIGFYLMKQNVDILHVLYLYYEEAKKTKVFASIRDHAKQMKIVQCVTEDKDLADYLRKEIYFPKYSVQQISFSVSEDKELPKDGVIQYGDGDCFVV